MPHPPIPDNALQGASSTQKRRQGLRGLFNFLKRGDEDEFDLPPASPSASSASGAISARPTDKTAASPARSSPEGEDAGGGEGDGGPVRFTRSNSPVGLVKNPVHVQAMRALGFPARCPVCWVCSWTVVLITVIAVGMVLRPPEVETNFDSFMKTDVEASTRRDVFMYARDFREEEDSSSARRRLREAGALDLGPGRSWGQPEAKPRLEDLDAAFEAQARPGHERRLQQNLYIHFDLLLAYDLADGGPSAGVFDYGFLRAAAGLERGLRAQPGWQAFCAQAADDSKTFCETGLSLMNYALPTLNLTSGIVPEEVIYDAGGADMVPLETAMDQVNRNLLTRIIFPKGFDATASTYSSPQLRTAYRFSFICCTTADPGSLVSQKVKEYKALWSAFVEETVIDYMEGQTAGAAKVFFAGTDMKEIEVMRILNGDLALAGGSMGFVLFYILLHTRSVLLGVVGLLIITLSVPFSYVLYAFTTNSAKMSIASFLSLFIIVGFGSDVVFVYSDIWRDSTGSNHERLAWTYKHAGKASLATTATTAVSFLANMVSVLKPLREFGFFMGLCVTAVWALLTLIFAPLCLIDEQRCKRCRLVRKPPKDDRPSFRSLTINAYTVCVHRLRHFCMFFTFLVMAIFLISAGTTASVDSSAPEILPSDHNQIAGQGVMDQFEDIADVFTLRLAQPSITAGVCSPGVESSTQSRRRRVHGTACSMFWCEVSTEDAELSSGDCNCFRSIAVGDCGTPLAVVHQRYVGLPDMWENYSSIPDVVAPFFLNTSGVSINTDNPWPGSILNMGTAPTHFQDWRTGTVLYREVTELKAEMRRESGGPCQVEDLCFCGTRVCDFPERSASAAYPVQLPPASRRLQAAWEAPPASRRLQAAPVPQWTVPQRDRAWVDVIFGLEVSPETPVLGEVDFADKWSFNAAFDPAQPWSQRNMIDFCAGFPPELLVTQSRCWIRNFAQWVSTQPGERFPVRYARFHELALSYAARNSILDISVADLIWRRDGEVKATYMMFQIDVSKTVPYKEAMEAQGRWDDYLASWNRGASMFSFGAWHTSELWVRAQVLQDLVSSTLSTIIIVLTLAFFGVLSFTGDFCLAIFVVVATSLVVCGILFFIVVVNQWAIGPIEVISLIVFIGYATTYSLHVAHRYGSREAVLGMEEEEAAVISAVRYQRTLWSLQSIGGAALGSAVTTAGCSIFLLRCQMPIFQKLGGVVLIVTVMSILTALGPLTATLMSFGPRNPGIGCLYRYAEAGWRKRPRWRARPARDARAGDAIGDVGGLSDALAQDDPAPNAAFGSPATTATPPPTSEDALLYDNTQQRRA